MCWRDVGTDEMHIAIICITQTTYCCGVIMTKDQGTVDLNVRYTTLWNNAHCERLNFTAVIFQPSLVFF